MDKRQLLIEHPIGSASPVKMQDKSVKQFVSESSIHLPEGVNDSSILIKGPVQRANVENKNRRIYPRTILEREMKKLNGIIDTNGGILGELDHPDIAVVGLKSVPVVIRKLWWDEQNRDTMMAIAELLDPTINPYAGIAYSVLKAGLPLGISSRGLGSVMPQNDISIVQEDFEMLTFDLVSDPSTHGAFMRHFNANKISEHVELTEVNNNISQELKNLSEERMINLLKSLSIPW